MIVAPVIRVVMDLPRPGAFDFVCADATVEDVGRLCLVPFGAGKRVGLIVAVAVEPAVDPGKLKPVLSIRRDVAPLDVVTLELFSFCADYYQAPLGQVVFGALPPVLRRAGIARRWREDGGDDWVWLTSAGVAALDTLGARAARRKRALQCLKEGAQRLSVWCAAQRVDKKTVQDLVTRNWIRVDKQAIVPIDEEYTTTRGPSLTDAQQTAIDAVLAARSGFAAFLLDGVTGSGKTEVYLHAAAACISRKGQVLMLVPEINLTPALLQRVRDRFPGGNIVEAHSGTGEAARFAAWRHAREGRADIVIGTRLAVFTPLPRLALVIVDEEHDVSLKQQEGVRYSARDVAVFRARAAQCPVILGSATPSLETLENVVRGRFRHLVLPERATAARLPDVQLIDLTRHAAHEGLTDRAIDAIETAVVAGEQAMVFINRRGFAPALVCEACSAMPECRHCAAHLVFHRGERKLKCHHCGWRRDVPAQCERCGSPALTAMGQGTERIEAALATRLPHVRLARIDGDTMRRKGGGAAIFGAVSRGEIDVLVGTQLLAKGHDFPNVTLVVVVNADGAVFSADFRAAERMAQQLIQVAGRAGRAARPGRVLIQTRFPQHPVYAAVCRHDYAGFVKVARQERRLMQLPPYCSLALLRAEARNAEVLETFFKRAGRQATEGGAASAGVTIGEPVASTLARKAGFVRRQMLLRSTARPALQTFLKTWVPELYAMAPRTVRWSIDVDPVEV